MGAGRLGDNEETWFSIVWYGMVWYGMVRYVCMYVICLKEEPFPTQRTRRQEEGLRAERARESVRERTSRFTAILHSDSWLWLQVRVSGDVYWPQQPGDDRIRKSSTVDMPLAARQWSNARITIE